MGTPLRHFAMRSACASSHVCPRTCQGHAHMHAYTLLTILVAALRPAILCLIVAAALEASWRKEHCWPCIDAALPILGIVAPRVTCTHAQTCTSTSMTAKSCPFYTLAAVAQAIVDAAAMEVAQPEKTSPPLSREEEGGPAKTDPEARPCHVHLVGMPRQAAIATKLRRRHAHSATPPGASQHCPVAVDPPCR